jgi:ribosomal protein S11
VVVRNKKPAVFALLKRTNNNFFVSLSYKDEEPFYHSSAGVLGLAGSRRDSPTSIELTGRALSKQIRLRGYKRFYLRISSVFDSALRAFLRGLKFYPVTISKIEFVKPVTHNGVRLKKPRRM